MLQKDTLKQPAYLVAGVLFTLIALVAIIALLVLKSKADTALQQVNIGASAPTFDNIVVSDSSQGADIGLPGGAGFTTNEGAVKSIFVRGTVSDPNGCNDLKDITVTVYRSGATGGAACTSDMNDCYTATLLPVDFVGCTGVEVTTVTFEKSFSFANFVDPSDAGSPYAAETWVAKGVVTDNANAPAELTEELEVNSLAAFSVPGSINYGAVGLGLDSDAIGLTFSNTGNRAVDADVVALIDPVHQPSPLVGDMTSNLTGFSDIPASAVHYSLASGFTYGTGDTAVSKLASTDLALNLLQQTNDVVVPTTDTYWKLRMPTSGVNGTYTNVLVFTAKASAAGMPLGAVNTESISNVKASTVVDNTSYVVASTIGSSSMSAYDITNSTEATLLGSTESIANATTIEKSVNDVYLTSQSTTDNFQVIDVSNTASPTIQDTATVMNNGITDVAINGNYAYVVGKDTGGDFAIVDITTKTAVSVIEASRLVIQSSGASPHTVNSNVIKYNSTNNTVVVYSTDEAGYVGTHKGYVTVISVLNPNSPSIVGSAETYYDGTMTISADGNTAYVAGTSELANTLQSIDISTPASMTAISTLDINNNTPTDIVAVGNIVYVADASNNVTTSNLNSVNVTNNSAMTIIDSTLVGAAGQTLTISATASYVYASAQTSATYSTLNASTIAAPSGPTITTLESASFMVPSLPAYVVPFNAPVDLIINGTGFVDGEMSVLINGDSIAASGATVTVLSATQIEVLNIPAGVWTPGGVTRPLEVRNTRLEMNSNTVNISVIAS